MPENQEVIETQSVSQEIPAAELPQGDNPVSESTEPTEIRIGDQTFKTQAEAFAYAQAELARKEHEIALAEAYRAGITDAIQPQVESAPPAPQGLLDDPEWESKFYADPRKALGEFAEQIRKQVKGEVTGEITQVSQEEKLWQSFFARHPDLDGFKEDAQQMLTKHDAELRALVRTKGETAALDYLAQKTRSKFQDYIERAKPKRVLSNAPAASAPGTQTTVTVPQRKSAPVDFVTQLRNLRKSRM